MPSITATSIISKVKTVLQDTTSVRWSDDELRGYLNDGQREVSMQRPDACATIGNVSLVLGTRQAIPDVGTSFIRAVRNMGTDGATPGRAIRQVPMELLDANIPNWHASTAAAAIQHVAVDTRFPTVFFVYPPADGTSKMEIVYAAPPNEIPSLTGSGTYSQTGTTVTVTLAAHGLAVGSWVYLSFTTGTATSGTYQVATVSAANTFTVTAPTASTSGNVTVTPVINVDDVFATPLLDYVCFRAYTKDQDLTGNADRASMHRKLFDGVMQAKAQADATVAATKTNVKG